MADEGLKIDPYNADLYDLKSNACLFLSNFKCAVDALETMYATDSTKADTLFFTKISAAAAEGEESDTRERRHVALKKWGPGGSTGKYPDNPYASRLPQPGPTRLTGQTDSVVSVTNRIIAKDTTAVASGAGRRRKVSIEGKTSKPGRPNEPTDATTARRRHQTTEGSFAVHRIRDHTATPRPRRTRRPCCTRAAPPSLAATAGFCRGGELLRMAV